VAEVAILSEPGLKVGLEVQEESVGLGAERHPRRLGELGERGAERARLAVVVAADVLRYGGRADLAAADRALGYGVQEPGE
jgi:hypothetical protein